MREREGGRERAYMSDTILGYITCMRTNKSNGSLSSHNVRGMNP